MNERETPLPQHIILIGFMGCGKSTVGKELQKKLNCPLIDTDEAIEQLAGKSISTIFEENGEEDFRDRETAFLRHCEGNLNQSSIISTGGGAILREENRQILQRLGYVVWLKIDANTVYLRTRKNTSRPILQQANPKKIITDLLELRTPLYRECANLIIDIAGLNRHEITTGIVESARYHFSQSPS
jgi:shikimate kinase